MERGDRKVMCKENPWWRWVLEALAGVGTVWAQRIESEVGRWVMTAIFGAGLLYLVLVYDRRIVSFSESGLTIFRDWRLLQAYPLVRWDQIAGFGRYSIEYFAAEGPASSDLLILDVKGEVEEFDHHLKRYLSRWGFEVREGAVVLDFTRGDIEKAVETLKARGVCRMTEEVLLEEKGEPVVGDVYRIEAG